MALELRRDGQSYSYIKRILGVSKSTLSYWLRDYPLSPERIRELRDWNERRIERFRETRRKKREALLRGIYEEEKKKIYPLLSKEWPIFLAGLFLYWAEGSKTQRAEIRLSNTNPAVIKAFLHWLNCSFEIDKKKIKVRLHLYRDMDIKKETSFWAKRLGISALQFRNPYIKDSRLSSLTYKNGFGHGTCNVDLCNVIIARKVHMGLKFLSDYFMGV